MATANAAIQRVDLYGPIAASRVGPAPLVLRVGVTPSNGSMVGGVPSSSMKVEQYVLVSALPAELRARVELAVQALLAGM